MKILFKLFIAGVGAAFIAVIVKQFISEKEISHPESVVDRIRMSCN